MVSVQQTDDWQIETAEPSYEMGVPDFNGNTQIPESGKSYMVVVDSYQSIFRSKWSKLSNSDKRTKYQVCIDSYQRARMFRFESFGGGHYRIESAGRYLTLVNNRLEFDENIQQDGNAQLFRLVINLGGSVTIMSMENNNRVLRADASNKVHNGQFYSASFKANDAHQRFYLRTECVQSLKAYPDETRDAYYTKYNREAVQTVTTA